VSPETSTSTPEPSLGERLVQALENQPDPAPKGEPDPDHWAKVNADHSREIGEARTRIADLERNAKETAAPQAEQTEGTERLFKEPDRYMEDWKRQVVEEVEKRAEEKYGADLAKVRGTNVATQIAGENPISAKLLQDPKTQTYLTELSKDPTARKTYENVDRNQLLAVLYDRMIGLMSNQETARTTAPPPARPENGGITDPASTTTATPPKSEMTPQEVADKGIEWGWQQFQKGVAVHTQKDSKI
jgi:hypothetical protein